MRTLTVLATFGLLLFTHLASADVYRCEVPGKKTEYRPTPCVGAAAKVIKIPTYSPNTNGSKNHGEPHTSPEELGKGQREMESRPRSLDERISIDLPNTPLVSVLQVLADFSGKELVYTSALSDIGTFKYKNLAARVVLMDIADRYHFQVQIDAEKMNIGRR